MSHNRPSHDPKDSPVALALRSEDFVPLPRLWVKRSDMPKIMDIAGRHKDEVNRIRAKAHDENPSTEDRRPVFHKDRVAEEQQLLANAVHDKDAAWAAYERAMQEGRL